MNTPVKICGIKTPEALKAAIDSGARYIGFVFYAPSPRNITLDTAASLARAIPTSVRAVGLFVDPTDEELERILSSVSLDMIQLHGGESPGRIAEIKARHHLPVMKAIRISTAADLENITAYEAAADWLLFDAKVSEEQGGTGHSFDWSILKSREFSKPWMLAGGLNADNVAAALSILSPNALDISSGVESVHGQKDASKITAFMSAVKAAS